MNRSQRFLRHLEPHQAALEAYCRRSLINPSDIEDALQAAVLGAFCDFSRFVEHTNFRAWMFQYVRHEVLAMNRRRGKAPQPLPVEDPPASPGGPEHADILDFERLLNAPEQVLEDFDDCLAAVLKELPDAERDVLLLRAIGDLKYREIAELLDIPIGSVMGYLSRARREFRQRLAASGRDRGLFAG